MRNIILILSLLLFTEITRASVSLNTTDSLPAWQEFKKISSGDLLQQYQNNDTTHIIVRTILLKQKRNKINSIIAGGLLLGLSGLLLFVKSNSLWADAIYITIGVVMALIFLVLLLALLNLTMYKKLTVYNTLKKFYNKQKLPLWVKDELKYFNRNKEKGLIRND